MTVVGILKADSVLDDLKRSHGDYSDMFTRILSTAAHPCEVKVYDVEHHEYPPELDACDGYLITGSKRSVYETSPGFNSWGILFRPCTKRERSSWEFVSDISWLRKFLGVKPRKAIGVGG